MGGKTPERPDVRIREDAAATAGGSRLARWGMAAILLLFGYEWLLSGLNKLLSPDFRTGLAANLQQALPDNPNRWYVHFLLRAVVPHARVVAVLVEGGELLAALGLAAGAALWLGGERLPGRWARTLHLGVIGALIGSALMTANYYLMAGNTLPWLHTGGPFNEGLDIDGLLTLVALALLAIQVLALRAPSAIGSTRPAHPAPTEPSARGEVAGGRRRLGEPTFG